jgi:hypothetical protein
MAKRPKFTLIFAPQAIDHLDRIESKYHRNGKAVAVLMVPNDDDDLERLLLERSPRFQAMLKRSRQTIKQGGGLSEEDFWKAVRKRAQDRKAAAAADRPTKR